MTHGHRVLAAWPDPPGSRLLRTSAGIGVRVEEQALEDVETAPSVIPTLFDGAIGKEPILQSISKSVLRSDSGGLLVVINQVL